MSDDIFAEVLDLIYGGDTISKMNPAQSDLAAQKDKRTRALTAGLSAVGATAGAAGLGYAGHEFRRGMKEHHKAGTPHRFRATVKSKKFAAALIPLEVAGLGGELLATKILHGDVKHAEQKKGKIKKYHKHYGVSREPSKTVDQVEELSSLPDNVKTPPTNKGDLTRAAIANPKVRRKGLEYTKKGAGKLVPTGAIGHADIEKSDDQVDVVWDAEIAKANPDKQQIFGWASVVEVDGKPIEDLQGDLISIEEMERAGYEYVLKSRKGGDMHLRDEWEPVQKSEMIESFIVTPEKREALGLDDSVPSGWWVGFQVRDPEVWAKVKSGERTGFSIHGRGHRSPVSKADTKHKFDPRNMSEKQKHQAEIGAGAGAAGVGTAAVLGGTKIPEHSHYDKKTRKYLHKLPAGEHEVPLKMLTRKNPRKLGARKQQRSYVAAMAKERPLDTYSPVPVTRYKGKGHPVIQRDNAHSVMSHAMKGRKTVRINIEDAPGHRPVRRTGEELVRRGQAKYQQKRVNEHMNIGDKRINELVRDYKKSSRKANTSKRPHGVVEEKFSYSKKPYGIKQAFRAGKNISQVAKARSRADERRRGAAAGVTGVAGAGTLAATPVRRSASKVKIKDGQIKAKDARKILSPGYRPGNANSIRQMAHHLGPLEDTKTTVIRYKGGHVIPWDGNHRATARIARGDKAIPVHVIEGKERPAISVAENAYHVARQRIHRSRMKADQFKPISEPGKKYTPKHRGDSKSYDRIANSPSRAENKLSTLGESKSAMGPTKAALRTKQGAVLGAGGALLTTSAYLAAKKEKKS